MKQIFYFVAVMVILGSVFTSCKKDPITRQVYIDTIIGGNAPPDFNGVAGIKVQNFVNRTYIDLIGREPLEDERNTALNILYADSLSDAAKEQVADQVMADDVYYDNFYEMEKVEILQGTDSSYIFRFITIDSILIDREEQKPDSIKNQLLIDYYIYEMDKLYLLLSLKEDYANGLITINEFYKRLIFNQVYDEINMGSANFVKAAFEGLFMRLPTDEELNAGIKMVDGFTSSILLKSGTGKADFVDIVVNSEDFYEGLVLKAFKNLLLRAPTSEEMSNEVLQITSDKDYKELQKRIIKTEEYAGF